jgi:hypothetical protein
MPFINKLLSVVFLIGCAIPTFAQFTELDGVTDDVFSIHYASNGVIWIGGDGETWKSTNFGNNIVTLPSLATTGWGTNVFGTTDGIYGLSATDAFMVGIFSCQMMPLFLKQRQEMAIDKWHT